MTFHSEVLRMCEVSLQYEFLDAQSKLNVEWIVFCSLANDIGTASRLYGCDNDEIDLIFEKSVFHSFANYIDTAYYEELEEQWWSSLGDLAGSRCSLERYLKKKKPPIKESASAYLYTTSENRSFYITGVLKFDGTNRTLWNLL